MLRFVPQVNVKFKTICVLVKTLLQMIYSFPDIMLFKAISEFLASAKIHEMTYYIRSLEYCMDMK